MTDKIIEDKRFKDKISYTYISRDNKFREPIMFANTYEDALALAKFDQPADRPYYIVKVIEHFEICGEVKDDDK